MLRKYDDMLTRRFSTQYRNVTDGRTDRIAIEISRVRNLRQARSQPSDNGLEGGCFPPMLDLFQDLKIGSS